MQAVPDAEVSRPPRSKSVADLDSHRTNVHIALGPSINHDISDSILEVGMVQRGILSCGGMMDMDQAERLLPMDHRIIASKTICKGLLVEYLVEGPLMPEREEDEPTPYVSLVWKQKMSAYGSGVYATVYAWFYHRQDAVWMIRCDEFPRLGEINEGECAYTITEGFAENCDDPA